MTLCSDNYNNSLILGDKRPYLSLPRPGVSITPSVLMNNPANHWFVILWLTPLYFTQKHSLTNLKTAKAVKLDAEVPNTMKSSCFQHNASRPVLHLALTAVNSSLGNLLSLSRRSDGVCIIIGCNIASRKHTGSRIMLIIENLCVLTNEQRSLLANIIFWNNIHCNCLLLTLHVFSLCVCVCRSRQAWPSWVWSCVCCRQTWTRRWRNGRSRSMTSSGRARAWPAWPTACTCSPGNSDKYTHAHIFYVQPADRLKSFQSSPV